jgi:hypothetical protein
MNHMKEITPYMEKHIIVLRSMHPRRRSVNQLHISHFNTWFTNQLRDVEAIDPIVATLTRGPTWEVRKFQVYKISGYTFAMRKKDSTTTTQNTGVCLEALEENEEIKQVYYGYIEEI